MQKFSINFESLANIPGHVNAYWFDTKHTVLGCNQACADMHYKYYNIKKEDFIGRRLCDIFPASGKYLAVMVEQENEQVMQSGIAQQFINIAILPPGHKIKFLTLKAPYFDQNDNIAGVFGISHYVSEVSLGDIQNLKFSTRENECLMRLLKGQTMREMSEALNISLKTVGTYIDRLKAKLNCTRRSQLISKALELGLQENL